MTATDETPEPRRPRLIFLLPLAVFVALAAVFLIRLETAGNLEAVPSALVGKPVPEFDLPPLEGRDPAGPQGDRPQGHGDGGQRLRLVVRALPHRASRSSSRWRRTAASVWSASTTRMSPPTPSRFLDELGNPYAAIGVDQSGRAAIDWGVYGVPETFVVDANGIIRHKHIGPIDAAALEATVLPAIEAAMKPAE